jgi:hypothetical protein
LQALAPCLDELQRLQDAVEAEDGDSDGRKAAEQQLKLYMQVCASMYAIAQYLPMANAEQWHRMAWQGCQQHAVCGQCADSKFGASLQRQFLAETKTEVKQQLLDMGIFNLGKVMVKHPPSCACLCQNYECHSLCRLCAPVQVSVAYQPVIRPRPCGCSGVDAAAAAQLGI